MDRLIDRCRCFVVGAAIDSSCRSAAISLSSIADAIVAAADQSTAVVAAAAGCGKRIDPECCRYESGSLIVVNPDRALIARSTLFRCCCNRQSIIGDRSFYCCCCNQRPLLLLLLISPLLLLLLLLVLSIQSEYENYDESIDGDGSIDTDHSTAAAAVSEKRKE